MRTMNSKGLLALVMLLVLCAGLFAAPAAGENPGVEHPEVVHFDRTLDDYQPQKDHYNFYFMYKTVHAWWDAVAIGMELVKALTPWYFTFVLVEIISGTLRAAGDSFTSMIITATTICVFRVIWVYFIAPLNPTSYLMIWYCFPVSWVLSSVVFWIYFKTGRWLKKAGLNLE